MIKTDAAYKKTKKHLLDQEEHIKNEKERFKKMGLTDEQIIQAIQPLEAYKHQIEDDLCEYENIINGKIDDVFSIDSIGKMLISYRIYSGITQSELAQKLGVSEAQVSKDEKNEYNGATTVKINSVIKALNIKIRISIEN